MANYDGTVSSERTQEELIKSALEEPVEETVTITGTFPLFSKHNKDLLGYFVLILCTITLLLVLALRALHNSTEQQVTIATFLVTALPRFPDSNSRRSN
jgi:hypothetical protein